MLSYTLSLQLGRLTLHKLEGQETSELPDLDKHTLRSLNKEDTQYEITVLEEKLAQMKPNMAAIAEYRKKVGAGHHYVSLSLCV